MKAGAPVPAVSPEGRSHPHTAMMIATTVQAVVPWAITILPSLWSYQRFQIMLLTAARHPPCLPGGAPGVRLPTVVTLRFNCCGAKQLIRHPQAATCTPLAEATYHGLGARPSPHVLQPATGEL